MSVCLYLHYWKRPYRPRVDGPRASVTVFAASRTCSDLKRLAEYGWDSHQTGDAT